VGDRPLSEEGGRGGLAHAHQTSRRPGRRCSDSSPGRGLPSGCFSLFPSAGAGLRSVGRQTPRLTPVGFRPHSSAGISRIHSIPGRANYTVDWQLLNQVVARKDNHVTLDSATAPDALSWQTERGRPGNARTVSARRQRHYTFKVRRRTSQF